MDRGATFEPRATTDRIRSAGPAYRLVAAVILVGASPLAGGASTSSQIRFGLIVAFVWIPLAGLLAVVGRRTRHAAFDALGLGLDLSLLGMLEVVLSPRPEVYVLAHLLLVAYYTYVGGRRLGLVAAGAGFVLVASIAGTTSHGFDGVALAVYPIVVVGLVWMLDTAAVGHRQEADRVVRLSEKSDAILTGVTEAVMVTRPGGRVAEWNRAAERTFGCPSEYAVGRTCTDVLGLRLDVRELDCGHQCALLDHFETTGAPTGTDVELWRVDEAGERRPLLATAIPVVDKEAHVVEIVHSFRDITKLKQADEAKTLFLATTSHELKTPLTVIRGFSEMLLSSVGDLTDDERGAALRAINLRARQLSGIVDRLLLSSRIEAGRVDLEPGALDVVPILEEQVSALRSAAIREISLHVDGSLPRLWADEQAFTTVVDHLLDNAVKYSPGGGPIVVIASERGDHVEVSVRDEGVGMTEEQAARCFDRFWQAELSDIRRFGGTGIGLYIVRSLVEAMDGRISVSSAPGRGSTFTVSLWCAERIPHDHPDDLVSEQGRGDPSIIREYMRQLGVRLEARE